MNQGILFERAKQYATDYMDKAAERRPYPAEADIKELKRFEGPLPEKGQEPEAILEMLHQYGEPATTVHTGGRYFGFVCGSVHPVAVATKWMADSWDQNAGLFVMSPIASRLEEVCEKQFVELLDFPEGTAAGFVSGASMATFCALTAARNEICRRAGYDVGKQGMFQAPEIRVVLSREAHASVFRALSLLGLGSSRVELVEADQEGRMMVDKVPELDDRTIFILQAGHVNTGAFDDMQKLCQMGREAGAWIHVDGAVGLFAAACESKKHLTRGMELADSWAADVHKTLNAPYDNGIVFCRDRGTLLAAMQISASYLPLEGLRDGAQYTTEMSRRARGMELWSVLQFLGRQGVDDLIQQLCDRATLFATLLREEGLTVGNEVVFNQVIFRGKTDEETVELMNRLQKSGSMWCGGAIHNGKKVIRISTCSYAIREEDVRASVETIRFCRKNKQKND